MTKKYIVHIEDDKEARPRPHERTAAELLAEHFNSDIIFLRRAASRTPDLYVLKTNIRWELKSLLGGSKYTIQNNPRETYGQSENVIIDLSRAKLSDKQGISRVKDFFKKEHSRIRRIKVITKKRKIIDIKS